MTEENNQQAPTEGAPAPAQETQESSPSEPSTPSESGSEDKAE